MTTNNYAGRAMTTGGGWKGSNPPARSRRFLTKDVVVAALERAMQLKEVELCPDCFADLDEETGCVCTEICGLCNGSGEGRYDGSTCPECRGVGER